MLQEEGFISPWWRAYLINRATKQGYLMPTLYYIPGGPPIGNEERVHLEDLMETMIVREQGPAQGDFREGING